MNKVESVGVKVVHDDCPDVSWLGEYTDNLHEGVIVRDYAEFYERLPVEMERDADGRFLCKGDPDLPGRGREYRGFIPYAWGEKPGTKDFYKYGMQDFKRMEGLERGDWYLVGVMAEAIVSYEVYGGNRRLETLTSSGLWGVESDAGRYLEEIKKEQLEELKNHLQRFNVDVSDWETLVEDIELEWG